MVTLVMNISTMWELYQRDIHIAYKCAFISTFLSMTVLKVLGNI